MNKIKKKFIYFIIFLSLIVFRIEANAQTLRIPYSTQTAYVGSTIATVEIGINDSTYSYASIQAQDNVDGTIILVIYYNNDQNYVTRTTSFSQKTYGDLGYDCGYIITRAEAYYTITSDDGYKSGYIAVQ